MSPLWKSNNIRKFNKQYLKIQHKKPSPRHIDNSQGLAQGQYSLQTITVKCRSIKGISLLSFLSIKMKGGMTVEAALVLPLFLLFFLNLSCALEMIRLHGNLELAIWEVGNRLSLYGYALELNKDAEAQNKDPETGSLEREGKKNQKEDKEEWWDKLSGIAFSYGYIRSQMVEYAGKDYLDASPLTYGAEGLQFLESSVFEKQDEFEINVTYAVGPWSDIAGFWPFRMANRYYGHIWNGYEIPGCTQQDAKAQDTVYVAENGKVYHEDRECSHLNVSVQQAPLAEIGTYRNENGSKYIICDKCKNQTIQGMVYITEEGKHYHYTRDCPGLKRTVYSLLRIEAGDYEACKRCGGGQKG